MVIKEILTLLDYSFYRITMAFSKSDSYDSGIAIIILSLTESLYVVNIIGIIVIESFNRVQIQKYAQIASVSYIVLLGLLYYLNMKRYNGKYIKLKERWGNEREIKKVVKAILIIIFVLFPIVFPAIILNLKDYTQ